MLSTPTASAAAAYVVMFGMMFGDVGDAAVILVGLWLWKSRNPRVVGRAGRGH